MAHSLHEWITKLGYDAVPGITVRRSDDCPADRPFAAEIRTMFEGDQGLAADAFACIDRVPTVALIDRVELPNGRHDYRAAVRALCERLWNQNLVRILLVTEPDSFEVWSVDNPDVAPERVGRDDEDGLQTWSLSGLLGGRALANRGRWFDPDKRVDRHLLENIQELVRNLSTKAELSAPLARELTARTIFVAYLEDRGIISAGYHAEHKVGWLHELLGRADNAGLDRLFGQLQKDFNGDFLEPLKSGEARWADLDPGVLTYLHDFLNRTVLRSGQQDFWRYDFSEIPIELIAGIYETFLASKDDDHAAELAAKGASRTAAAARSKRKQGAFYTPRLLAEAVVDMALHGRDPLKEVIFDGACGSGMLLTAVFRRLMRAQQARAERAGLDERAYGFEARCELLETRIFGADIDEDACRLTSFSLYLALLSDLTPRDLAVLRAGGHKLPSLLGNIRRGKVEGDFLSPESEEANKERFTLLISNPPWRKLRKGDPGFESLAKWLVRTPKPHPHIPGRELAAAFAIAAASTLRAGGRAALILPVNMFLSAEGTRRAFRAGLLGRYHIRRVVNFADMRYLLFSDARHPFVVLVADARDRDETADISDETFAYETPKADIALAFGRLGLHGDDTTVLPASTLIDRTAQLALRYWGDARDMQVLRRLRAFGRVGDLVTARGWVAGKGFHLVDNDVRKPKDSWSIVTPAWLASMPFLDATRLGRDTPTTDSLVLETFPHERIAREPPEPRLFSGPRVIWPDGTNPAKGINAIYAERPFSFQHSLGVLAAPEDETGRLLARFLATYMRSTLGGWLSLLLSASVSAERAKLHQGELLEWPFWHPEAHPDPALAWKALARIDTLLSRLDDGPEVLAGHRYAGLKPELDDAVFDYFLIRADERSLIEELVKVIGPSVQPAGLGYKSLAKEIRMPPAPERLERYVRRLAQEMERWRDATGGAGRLRTSYWTARRVPLGVAMLEVDAADGAEPRLERADPEFLQELADALDRTVRLPGGALLNVPNLTIIDGRRILLVKPLVTRYWLERSASADAARIATELQAVEGHREHEGPSTDLTPPDAFR